MTAFHRHAASFFALICFSALQTAVPLAELVLLPKAMSLESEADLNHFLPALILWTVFLCRHRQSLSFGLQGPMAALHIILLGICYAGSGPAAGLTLAQRTAYVYGMAGLSLGSASLLFVDAAKLGILIWSRRISVLFGMAAAFSQILYNLGTNFYLWPPLSRMVTRAVLSILQMLGYAMIPDPNPIMVRHEGMVIRINPSCSGLDGVFFFVAAFSFMMMLDFRKYRPRYIVATYAAGIAYMLALNVLRIVVFFAAALWAVEKWPDQNAAGIFADLFHSNLGWVLYAAGLVLFAAVFYRISPSSTSAKRDS